MGKSTSGHRIVRSCLKMSMLCSAPVLAAPQFDKSFSLQFHVKNARAGAVLIQANDQGVFFIPFVSFRLIFVHQLHYSFGWGFNFDMGFTTFSSVYSFWGFMDCLHWSSFLILWNVQISGWPGGLYFYYSFTGLILRVPVISRLMLCPKLDHVTRAILFGLALASLYFFFHFSLCFSVFS